MSEPVNEKDEKEEDERGPTTISTRVWCSREIAAAAKLIASDPSLLPPDLAEHAKAYGPRTGGYPLWLVHGLAARHFRLSLERYAATREMAPVPSTKRTPR